MELHHRIDKSATRKGEYIGYCNGVQRIRRGGDGWKTYALGSASGIFTSVTAQTLWQLGGQLEYIASNNSLPTSPLHTA